MTTVTEKKVIRIAHDDCWGYEVRLDDLDLLEISYYELGTEGEETVKSRMTVAFRDQAEKLAGAIMAFALLLPEDSH